MRGKLYSLLAGAVLLSGCASISANRQWDVDAAQIERIEIAARSVGVQVHWVNFPTKVSATTN